MCDVFIGPPEFFKGDVEYILLLFQHTAKVWKKVSLVKRLMPHRQLQTSHYSLSAFDLSNHFFLWYIKVELCSFSLSLKSVTGSSEVFCGCQTVDIWDGCSASLSG